MKTLNFSYVLNQVCKDYEGRALHLSKKEQEKWEEYASKFNLDVKKNVQNNRPKMTIN